MPGPIIGQNQFVQYGAEPGAYLMKGMQTGSAIKKNEADIVHQQRVDDMTNQYKNVIMDEHRQKTEMSTRANDPVRTRNMALGLWALGVDDKTQFDQAKQLIFNDLPEEEKQKLGDPSKWTKADIARTLGTSMMGSEFGTLERFAQNYFTSRLNAQTKKEIQDKKTDAKETNDPKYSQAWMQLAKTVRPTDLNDARKSFNELKKQGIDPFEAATQVGDALATVRKDYLENIAPIETENEATKKKWFGDKTPKAIPKKKTAYDILFGGETGESDQPPQGAVNTKKTSGGKPVYKLPNGDFWVSPR